MMTKKNYNQPNGDIEFTGEVWIPGKTPHRIEQDHLERYYFASQFVKGKTILDIACGVGGGSRMLAQAGAEKVVGVDINPKYISYARKFNSHPAITYIKRDVQRFTYHTSFDVIIFYETIEHLVYYRQVLLTLNKLLNRRGRLIISTPNRQITSPGSKSLGSKPRNSYHQQEFTIPEMTSLLKSIGLSIPPDFIFGQRYRWFFPHPYFNNLYQRIFSPDNNSSSVVRRSRFLTPRYFIVVAQKP